MKDGFDEPDRFELLLDGVGQGCYQGCLWYSHGVELLERVVDESIDPILGWKSQV